jgi:hypothetical protein
MLGPFRRLGEDSKTVIAKSFLLQKNLRVSTNLFSAPPIAVTEALG